MNINYKAWRKWCDDNPPKNGESKLNHVDLFTALDDLVPQIRSSVESTSELVLERWKQQEGFKIKSEEVIGCGVRDLLGGVWFALKEKVDQLLVPSDVYPVYFDILSDKPIYRFSVLPQLKLDFLSRCTDRALLLLPVPLHPSGLHLGAPDAEVLNSWLGESEDRWLVIDAVYNYGKKTPVEVERLMDAERCIVLRSMSKAWLCRKLFGVAEVPEKLKADIQASVTTPTEEGMARCLAALEADVRTEQRERIAKGWRSAIEILDPHLGNEPLSETGYLGIVRENWLWWLQRGIHVVPASVFGSNRDDLSVVSCLDYV